MRGSGWVEGRQDPQDVHVVGGELMLYIQELVAPVFIELVAKRTLKIPENGIFSITTFLKTDSCGSFHLAQMCKALESSQNRGHADSNSNIKACVV